MKLFVCIGILLTLANTVFADPPDISEKSPDGGWLFKAHWYGGKGYSWELANAKSGQTYFAIAHPEQEQALPTRLSGLWGPGNHYVAINIYYGRLLYQTVVLALQAETPVVVDWPRPTEASMIKAEDSKLWSGDGSANYAVNKWTSEDTLILDIDMHAELSDKASGQKYHIDSTREQAVQFTGLKGKVLQDQPPDYDKQTVNND